ncbi:hypothetical protein MAR_033543 [Mya arenaria]|uniref:Uncharacterized protein n=1 Tax=Mya arenaria TaxID=6604 RepID=A0ABY7GIJ2_MYAAR|nr:hypothetical protein MAR_033543 [Mya arenaria]
MLGGEAITLRGPCFTAGQVIEASIPSLGVTFPCEVELDASVAICVMPSLFRTGELTLVLNDTDSSVIFNSVHIMNVPALVTRRAPDNWWSGRMVTVSWQDVDHVPASIQKEESGSRPEMVMVGNYSVDPGATHRQFRMDIPRGNLSTLRSRVYLVRRISRTVEYRESYRQLAAVV